ncbi:Non-specific lipid-transfer protein 12 [Euphorbia peplus]|nr:Non-specific lipid-transfer protein 12 [Euphorbia peplus]
MVKEANHSRVNRRRIGENKTLSLDIHCYQPTFLPMEIALSSLFSHFLLLQLYFLTDLTTGMLSGGEGLRCGDVVRSMAPCLNYLKNGGDPSPSCCDGVAKINDQAQTRDDRQQTCKCLQNASMHFSSRIDPSNAQALPSSCGLQLPYDMSLDTNCDGIN